LPELFQNDSSSGFQSSIQRGDSIAHGYVPADFQPVSSSHEGRKSSRERPLTDR
jgi:hypothetical protein